MPNFEVLKLNGICFRSRHLFNLLWRNYKSQDFPQFVDCAGIIDNFERFPKICFPVFLLLLKKERAEENLSSSSRFIPRLTNVLNL